MANEVKGFGKKPIAHLLKISQFISQDHWEIIEPFIDKRFQWKELVMNEDHSKPRESGRGCVLQVLSLNEDGH
jgi:hypothetical protein